MPYERYGKRYPAKKACAAELNAEIEKLLKEITAVLLLPGKEKK